ncbi:MAG: gamma-glutamyltransferase [Chthoniobacteraceae bacterium]
MKIRTSLIVISVICLSPGLAAEVENIRGEVASVNPIATDAGLAVLRAGGNAVDAAVAVGLTLGVVDGYNSGIGGGCFMLIRRANGEIVALDGREIAPAAATGDMFFRNGKADTSLSQNGALAIGVPGSLAVYDDAIRRFGTMKLADLLRDSAELAERGFVIDETYAERIRWEQKELAKIEANRALFLEAAGDPLPAGTELKQPDLAASYRSIADEGIGWFYSGAYGEKLEAWMRDHGGVLTAKDFSDYKSLEREPVETDYRGWRVVSFPPPSSGGVHVIQILNILEHFDLAAMAPAARYHTIAEAMRLAFVDRAFWLGDPDFANVPRGLVDKDYARALADRIQPDRVADIAEHGQPPAAETDLFGRKHTTHFSVADAAGNWVACTATINTNFGSKVIIPGTGILLNNQLDDFSIEPGVPNAFGLIGAEANAVAPGKRPLSSMSPTIVLKGNEPVFALGAAGGPKIITQTALNLVGLLDLGLTIDQALAQPRIHHQWRPDTLLLENTVPEDVRAALEAMGHHVRVSDSVGVSVAIGRDLKTGAFSGAADPRVNGKAAGY